ncbi:hypothetical protein AMTRI_Chr03g53640 [Amborella trichopoda]
MDIYFRSTLLKNNLDLLESLGPGMLLGPDEKGQNLGECYQVLAPPVFSTERFSRVGPTSRPNRCLISAQDPDLSRPESLFSNIILILFFLFPIKRKIIGLFLYTKFLCLEN